MSSTTTAFDHPVFNVALPLAFVLLWSTGFIGAKYGLPHAEPFTFLALRFAITAVLFAVIIMISRVRWLTEPRQLLHAAVVGVLMHGVYLGGVFFAIDNGMSGGIAALIAGLQPVLTAAFAILLLRETLNLKNWIGLALGFVGITLVVWRQAGDTGGALGLGAAVAGLLGMTFATLYQKRFVGTLDLRVGSAVQFAAAAALMAVCALATEDLIIDWQPQVIFAMTWLILVLSFGAVPLLILLIRHGAASKVASLFYLVPPVVALEMYFLFGETLSLGALFGMALAVVGVALVSRG